VPIFIKDYTGTPIGRYQGAGLRIGGFALQVVRPSIGTCYVRSAERVSQPAVQCGASGDVAVPGQYGGADFAAWRPSNGTWYVRTAEGTLLPAIQWGTAGDIPVPGDYDGDGVTDMAVFRPSNEIWYVRFSGGGTAAIVWGASGDIPVAADSTGDGRTTGFSIPRRGSGTSSPAPACLSFRQLPGEGPGTCRCPRRWRAMAGRTMSVWRTSDGNWYVRSAESLFPPSVPWGASGDIPLAR
jgi:hypothetical protein